MRLAALGAIERWRWRWRKGGGGDGWRRRRAVRTQHPKELRRGPAPPPPGLIPYWGEKRGEEGIRREEEKEETGDVDERLPERDMQIKKA